jgi:uncharacterized protein (TIGR02246 family)
MRRVGRLSRPVLIAAFTAAVLALAGCGTSVAAPAQSKQLPPNQEVTGLFDTWNQALASGDPELVADRYAPDAVLLPTVSNELRSDRAEIVDYFEHFLENKPQGQILESHVKVLRPTDAIDAGTYRFTLTADGQQRTVDARYTFVYEKVGDQWLIVNHHSSAMPETEPEDSQPSQPSQG